jgi:hypothetical protein
MGGTYSGVAALAIGADGSLYAGGGFATAGGKPSSCIAQWLREVNMLSVLWFPLVLVHQ